MALAVGYKSRRLCPVSKYQNKEKSASCIKQVYIIHSGSLIFFFQYRHTDWIVRLNSAFDDGLPGRDYCLFSSFSSYIMFTCISNISCNISLNPFWPRRVKCTFGKTAVVFVVLLSLLTLLSSGNFQPVITLEKPKQFCPHPLSENRNRLHIVRFFVLFQIIK